MHEGWIYVLVNSSLPGLVKVGRTARPPTERVAELSSATGVPTPFVLAFEHPFADCIAAESIVHAELDRMGFRVAANREFFRGSPGDIVRVVMEAAAATSDTRMAVQVPPSAAILLAEGDRHLFGVGETLQDLTEALRCYRLAAGRGSLVAHERLGAIYGETRSPGGADRQRALRHLKDGARRGNYFCYCEMARIFADDRNLANFTKAWFLFFARRADSMLDEVEAGHGRYPIALRGYIECCLNIAIQPQHLPELRAEAELLMDNIVEKLDRVRNMPAERQSLAAVLRWSYQNLLPQSQEPAPTHRLSEWLSGWIVAPRGAAA